MSGIGESGSVASRFMTSEDQLEELAAEYGPGIFGYVTDNGQLIFSSGAGTSEVGTRTPLRAEQEFRLASATKMYIAVIMLRLIELRGCRLEDSVDRWLPGAVPDAAAVTIEHLLGMHSGIPDYLPELLGDPPDVRPV